MMDFQDISPETQEAFLQLLDNHLTISVMNLEKDKCVLPMLMSIGSEPDANLVVSLQPKSGNTDVEAALAAALQRLKKSDFDYALFSYSTKIGLSDDKLVDALKTYIFEKSGLSVVFFTPYKFSGLFKKKADYEKTIIGEIVENIFN